MPKDISDLKEGFHSIPVPPEVDLSIEEGIRRGKKRRNLRRILRPLTVAATVVLVFALSINFSPAFVGYVRNLGMDFLVNLFSGDKGISQVLERGYGQVIDKSASDQGVTLTLENAIFDGRKLFLLVKLETKGDLWSLWPQETYLDGAPKVSHSCSNVSYSGVIRYCYEYDFSQEEPLVELVFGCRAMEFSTDQGLVTLAGDWAVPFHLDKELARFAPKQIQVNQELSIGPVKFTVETLTMYPTVTDVSLRLYPANPVRCTGFKNPHLIDGKGNKYYFKSSSFRGDEYLLSVESTYFSGAKELTLAFDGVYFLPVGETAFILDMENDGVIDDGGLGVEFIRKSFFEHEGEQYLVVWFRPGDEEYQKNEEHFFSVGQVDDLKGNSYWADLGFEEGSGADKVYGLGLKVSQGVPSRARFRVESISKGLMVRARLKIILE